jgi:hypothetical protein
MEFVFRCICVHLPIAISVGLYLTDQKLIAAKYDFVMAHLWEEDVIRALSR